MSAPIAPRDWQLNPAARGLRRVDVTGGAVWLLRDGPLLRGDYALCPDGEVRPFLGARDGEPLLGRPVEGVVR